MNALKKKIFDKNSKTYKPKVLFVLHLPPPVHGASMIGDYIRQSVKIKTKFDADFINLSSSQTLHEIGQGGFKKNYRVFLIYFKVLKHLITCKYDLVYLTLTATGPGFYKDVPVVSFLKLFGRKIIYHFHNKGISNLKETLFHKFIYKFVFLNTKSIVISETLYKDFRRYLSLDNTFFCPCGIPVENNSTINDKALKPSSKEITFLFLSNMMKEKGVYDLLDACEILIAKNLNFQCQFVGAWSDISAEDFENEIQRRSLQQKVFAVGAKYGEEKKQFFKTADVFIFPTYYKNESFPLVILEAMQFGLPVISTFEGGIPDEVLNGRTGYLVNQHDIVDMAAKMELFIKEPTRATAMGIVGRERFLNLFTIDQFQDNLINILTTVIEDAER